MTSEEKRLAGLTRATIWVPKASKDESCKFAAQEARAYVEKRKQR